MEAVDLGRGGTSRSRSITEDSAWISAVIVWLAKQKLPSLWKGLARRRTDWTCASSMARDSAPVRKPRARLCSSTAQRSSRTAPSMIL